MQRIVKKSLCILLAILLFVPIIGNFNHSIVLASSGKYKVAKVTDDCKFEEKASYNDFDEAVDKMEDLGGEYGDYVVLSDSSLSPMKIVAMNCGIAIAYPYRHGSVTLDIYSKLNSKNLSGDGDSAKTYVAANNMMVYHSTYAFFEAGQHGMGYDHGYIKVTMNGFTGYTDLEYCDLVPYKFIEKGKKATLGGNASGQYAYSKPEYSEVLNVTRYKVEKDGKYTDLCLEQNYIYGTSLQRETNHIGVAPSFMSTGKYYYSSDGINFYSDIRLKNFVGTYYNFYQFVPARTYTHISKSKVKEYVNSKTGNTGALAGHGGDFFDSQDEFGFNAIIALGIGIHESGWGKSDLAINRNNLFGIAAYDGNVGAAKSFSSVGDCIDALMGDVLANYMDVNCQWYYSMSLGNKGGGFITSYASDPYWAEEIAQYYYAIDKYDNDNNGNLTDYNKIDIALVNSNCYFMKGNSASSSKWYQTANKFGYQKNLFIPVLEISNGFIKTQLPTPIKNGNVIHTYSKDITTTVPYDKNQSIGYIDLNNATLINCFDKYANSSNVDPATLGTMVYLESFDFVEAKINMTGFGIITGLNFISSTGVKHQLVLKDVSDDSNELVFDLSTTKGNVPLNDGFTYDYVNFNGSIDINNIENGNYIAYLRITNGDYSKEELLRNVGKSFSNKAFNLDDCSIKLNANRLRTYRFEIEKLSTPIDYTTVNKPKTLPSVFTLDSISFDEANNLDISATAFIQGANFGNDNNVSHKIYLINSKNNYLSKEATEIESMFDYTTLLDTGYDLSNVSYTALFDIKDLIDGEYNLVTEIKTVDNEITYVDFVEIDNKVDLELPKLELDNRVFELTKSSIRDRIVLKVSTLDSED